MQPRRIVALIAIASLTLAAAVFAASASADQTVLCQTAKASPYCSSGERYPANTSISAHPEFPAETTVAVETSTSTVVCSSSTIATNCLRMTRRANCQRIRIPGWDDHELLAVLCSINPGGHPKSPGCGHLKIPHPECFAMR